MKLIIFDIDNTLIDSLTESDYKAHKITTKPDATYQIDNLKYFIFKRPYFDKLMEYCRKNFKYVAIWTHGDSVWAANFLKYILPKNYPLLFIYTRQKGGPRFGTSGAYKQLAKIWTTYSHLKINPHNTLIIEDTPENCELNMGNCIVVKPFLIKNSGKDDALKRLLIYLHSLKKIARKSVLSVDKSRWTHDSLEFEKKNIKPPEPKHISSSNSPDSRKSVSSIKSASSTRSTGSSIKLKKIPTTSKSRSNSKIKMKVKSPKKIIVKSKK